MTPATSPAVDSLTRVHFPFRHRIAIAEEGAGPLPSRWTNAAIRRADPYRGDRRVLRDERVRASVAPPSVTAAEGGGSTLAQRASFIPGTAWGRLYWDAMRPLHAIIFRGMADGIVRAAETRDISLG